MINTPINFSRRNAWQIPCVFCAQTSHQSCFIYFMMLFLQVLLPVWKCSDLSLYFSFFFYFTSHEYNHCATKIPHNNSSLFFFAQFPWDIRDGLFHWLRHKLKQNVRSTADKKALCKILLCLDRWFAPVLITTIKHSSISWSRICLALNSNPLLWDNNTTKDFVLWSFGRI